ncbi:MAG: GEVED domain-containing protein [Bacteroidia bacterium]|nr:GEVED domain-containing protein [Bacteroidia bacterium]
MKKIIFFSFVFSIITITQVCAQWQVNTGPNNGSLESFAVNGSDIFTGTSTGNVFYSSDGGLTWTNVSSGLSGNSIFALLISGTNVIAGTSSGIFVSNNSGASWTTASMSIPGLEVMALAKTSSYYFASTFGGGVFRSSNNGTTWTQVNSGLTNLYVNAIVLSGSYLIAGTTSGIYRSSNNGSNWSQASGFPIPNVKTLAVGSSGIFAGNNPNGVVYRSTNSGQNWSTFSNGLGNNGGIISLMTYNYYVFAGTSNGGIFLSDQNTSNWTSVNTGLTNLNIQALASCNGYAFAGINSNYVWIRPLCQMVGYCLTISASVTNVTCNSGNNGSASITIISGASPYTYLWSTGQTTASISSLAAGTYYVTVSDLYSSKSDTLVISQPMPISVNAVTTDETCTGSGDGSISLSITSGTSPYAIAWSDAETLQSINSLQAGNYSVTITDSNFCIMVQNYSIIEPAPVVATCSNDLIVLLTDPAFPLNSGSPAGGNYSGPGLTGNVFDPAVAGIGLWPVSYVYYNMNGCMGSCTFIITVVNNGSTFDFGDAPLPYPTLLANNGAFHIINPDLKLGNLLDGEPDGQLGSLANDDDDGIIIPDTLRPGTGSTLKVTVHNNLVNAAYLQGWIDFNANGSWADANEQIITDLKVNSGTSNVFFFVPSNAVIGNTYARFRLSTTSGLSYNGAAPDGEVEDYLVTIDTTQTDTVKIKLLWEYTEQPLPGNEVYGSSPSVINLGPDVNKMGNEPDNFMEIVTGSDEWLNFYPELNSPALGIWRCFDALGNIEWARDTKSDEARSSVSIADINLDTKYEIAGGTTSGWCVEVMDRTGSWTHGYPDPGWTFPYPPQRYGTAMWYSSPAIGELAGGPDLNGPEVVIGNNPLWSVWAFDGNNSDGVNDGSTATISSYNYLGYPGPTGTEGVDWDVLWVFQTNGPVLASPTVGDVDNDGHNEVLIGSNDNNFYCLDGATGALKWSFPTGNFITGSAGLADFDNTGKLETVFGSDDGNVYFIHGDVNGNGIIDPTEYTYYATSNNIESSPAIADLDGDGNLETVIGSDDDTLYCLSYSPSSNTVTLKWAFATGGIVKSSPAIAYSGRSSLTVYAGSNDGNLYILNGSNGSEIAHYQTGGRIVTSPSIADINADGKLEIVFTVWSYDNSNSPDTFIVLRDNGSNVTPLSAPWPTFRHDASHTGFYNWAPPVHAQDVGVTEITSPTGSVEPGSAIVPRAIVHNFGTNSTQSGSLVTLKIIDANGITVYTSTQGLAVLPASASVNVYFTSYNVSPGIFTVKAYTTFAGDMNSENDLKTARFIVSPADWIQDFEAGTGGFTPSPATGGWEWGVPTSGPMAAYSGTKLWATNLSGNYSDNIFWKLTSPGYVAFQDNPVLSFWQWFDIEEYRDGGNVKINVDSTGWNLIYPFSGYNSLASWNNSFITDEPGWGYQSSGWQLVSFVLPVLNGQTFQIRWDLATDDQINRPGWYIDDVSGKGFARPLNVSISSAPVNCGGQTATVTVSATGGVPPYSGTGVFNDVAGFYTYTVTDNVGLSCTDTVTVTIPAAIIALVSVTDASCFGCSDGAISLSVTGGISPYSFNWSNGSTTQNNGNLHSGSYSFTISDTNNCSITGTFIVNQPPPPVSQQIHLQVGWSIFSTYIIPLNPDISVVLGVFPQVVISKDQDGNVYWPAYSVNNIGNLILGQGYQIDMTSSQIIVISGTACDPVLSPINLRSGWSLLGYLRRSPAPIANMLSSISSFITIVKNGGGQVYWPFYGVNQIILENPGEGYVIKTNAACTLLYPANAMCSKSEIMIPEPKHFVMPVNTGNNMTLGIMNYELRITNKDLNKSEIAAYDSYGHLVGSGVLSTGFVSVTLWGDDELTQEKDGLTEGEPFSLVLWDARSGEEITLSVDSWIEGDGNYTVNGISIAGKLKLDRPVSDKVILYQNMPNPFSGKTDLSFYLPEAMYVKLTIFNVVGELTEILLSDYLLPGMHMVELNSGDYQAGVYFYRLETPEGNFEKRMTILR